MCDQRWQLRQQKYTNIEAEPENRETNREVRKKTKEAKERLTGEQCKNIKKENDGRKQQGSLRHSHGDTNAELSSHRLQNWKCPDENHGYSKPVDLIL